MAMKMVKGIETFSYERSLNVPSLIGLATHRLRGDMVTLYKYVLEEKELFRLINNSMSSTGYK